VFNLVEALGGSDWLSFLAPALLDALGLPYTGSPTSAMMLSTHKLLAKERLCQAGLPTPGWFVLPKPGAVPPPVASPRVFRPGAKCIIKTVAEHASFGLDEHSLVVAADEGSLRAELKRVTAELARECFAEEYVDGREFNLSVLAGPDGPEVLPPAEIDFSAFPAGKPRIVGARAKWEAESFEYSHTPRRFRFPDEDRPLLDRLQSLARQCWAAFGLGGYARVDFRVDPSGHPWILEVNSNPCLSPDAGFAAALEEASIPFEQAIARILDDAKRR
jgi:D-alanine-D-alanine ligase